jgi:hypothetical protein
VSGWGIIRFVRWVSSRVNWDSDAGVCQGAGCAGAAHNYMGMMSTCVLGKCDRSAFARGCIFLG